MANPSTSKTNHPSDADLRQFAVGTLPDNVRPEIENHILNCPTCCELLENLGEDTLVNRLRDIDTQYESEITRTNDQDIPLELMQHDRYQVIDRIGRGGMGDVYRALHKMMDREVAIKVIKPHLVNNKNAIARFQNEIRAAAKLNHQNIVASHDAEQIGQTQILVMEYVRGEKLSDVVSPDKPLSIRRASFYARQLAQGLSYAHSQGLVHRDIKPQNVLVTSEGIVKFLDFGLAKFAREASEERLTSSEQAIRPDLTADGECFGTPDYVAPEQIRSSKQSDIRADIYSLGCTLWFMLTGSPMFPGGTVREKLANHLKQEPNPISSIRPDVPVQLAQLINRMTAKLPDHRPQTPRDVAKALKPFCSQEFSTPASRAIPVAQPVPSSEQPTAVDFGIQESPETPDAKPLPAATDWNPSRNSQSRKRSMLIPAVAASILAAALLGIGWLATGGFGLGNGPESTTHSPDDPSTTVANREHERSGLIGPTSSEVTQYKTKRVAVVVPFRNAYYPEVAKIKKQFYNSGIEVDFLSSQIGPVNYSQTSLPNHPESLVIHHTLGDASPDHYGAVIFTGAWHDQKGVVDLEFAFKPNFNRDAKSFIDRLNQQNKIISSVCGGTLVLARSGFLINKTVARCPYIAQYENESPRVDWTNKPFHKSQNCWTARSHEELNQLSQHIIKCLNTNEPPDYSKYK